MKTFTLLASGAALGIALVAACSSDDTAAPNTVANCTAGNAGSSGSGGGSSGGMAGDDGTPSNDPVLASAARMIEEGRQTFRFDTFGDEAF